MFDASFMRRIVAALLVLTGTAAVVPGQDEADIELAAVRRTTLAVSYPENDASSVDMIGTAMGPGVSGRADVERRRGRTEMKLRLDGLPHPQTLGADYTAYVLWAVAPEGQAENLAELTAGSASKVQATTSFNSFGLIVTAEPHAGVALPSPVIMAENVLRPGTDGRIQSSRIEYSGDAGALYRLPSPGVRAEVGEFVTPLPVLGARKAVDIARRAGAARYADREMREAEVQLAVLEQIWPARRKDPRDWNGTARDVMRLAERARGLAVEGRAQARLGAERRVAQRNLEDARTEADRAREEAEEARERAAGARAEAERARREAESYRDATARAERDAVTARQRAEQDAAAATARAEQDAAARVQQAQAETDRARREAEEAVRARAAMQERLYVSLSQILETRREARGLIVNLSDVLFQTGKAALLPGAREKLSRLAGILIAYPGPYRMQIEGHTDSVGTEQSNLQLSQARADGVRAYLTSAGVPAARILSTLGLGESTPVATNINAAGRQRNRRVELVIADAEVSPQR